MPVSLVTKDNRVFQMWNHILIYGGEMTVFHFKLTMHKSHKTNASQIFSWREQKSGFFEQAKQFYLLGAFEGILHLGFVTASETDIKK